MQSYFVLVLKIYSKKLEWWIHVSSSHSLFTFGQLLPLPSVMSLAVLASTMSYQQTLLFHLSIFCQVFLLCLLFLGHHSTNLLYDLLSPLFLLCVLFVLFLLFNNFYLSSCSSFLSMLIYFLSLWVICSVALSIDIYMTENLFSNDFVNFLISHPYILAVIIQWLLYFKVT